MSANNRLIILKREGKFILREQDVEDLDDSGSEIADGGPFNSLEEAVEAANDYQLDHEVEYGLQILI